MVGENVEVRILQIGRGQVKIGVVAPAEIEIFRTELARLNRLAAIDDWKTSPLGGDLRRLAREIRGRKLSG